MRSSSTTLLTLFILTQTTPLFAITTDPVASYHGGEIPNSNLGQTISVIDDLNGDGVPEIAVGAPQAKVVSKGVGLANIYSGGELELGPEALISGLFGSYQNAKGGSSVTPLGDITGDGVPELLFSAPGNTGYGSNTGKVEIYSMAFNGYVPQLDTIFIGDAGDQTGKAIANVGDFDGDGVTDLAYSQPGDDESGIINAGRVLVRSGALATNILLNISGSIKGGYFGNTLAALTDINGRTNGIVVGSEQFSEGKKLYVGSVEIFNTDGTLRVKHIGQSQNAKLGSRLAGGSDLDGDGLSDVLVGAPAANSARGEIWGISATGAIIFKMRGIKNGDKFGDSISFATDMNADNSPEIIVGAPGEGPRGSVYILSGADRSIMYKIKGPQGGFGFATSVAAVSTGLGTSYVLVGAPKKSGGGGFYVYNQSELGCDGESHFIKEGNKQQPIFITSCTSENGGINLKVSGPPLSGFELYASKKTTKSSNKLAGCDWYLENEKPTLSEPKQSDDTGTITVALSKIPVANPENYYLQGFFNKKGSKEFICTDPIKINKSDKPKLFN